MVGVDLNNSSHGFVAVGNDIYIKKGVAGVGKGPKLILVFGWMGAQLPHLYKYTSVYEQIYPNATIMLICCSRQSFFISDKANAHKMEPFLDVFEAAGCAPTGGQDKSTSILVHAFSNGGCFRLLTLNSLLAKRWSTKPPSQLQLPQSALILDSCPGTGGLPSTKIAFGAMVHNPILRQVAYLMITIMHYTAAFLMFVRLMSRTTRIDDIKDKLNTPSVDPATPIPWMRKATPRLYLYSKKDLLVPWTEVEAHASQGMGIRGFKHVTFKQFSDSPHVAHARSYPEEYWDAVQQHWDFAQSHPLD